jgi:ribosomal silencing factor RsfS
MLVAQAIVERGLIDTVVDAVRNALDQISYYIGTGNTKWVLLGLAVIVTFLFFKQKR